MAAARVAIWVACVLAMVAACQGRLRVGYYNRKCPPAEYVVRAVVGNAVPDLGSNVELHLTEFARSIREMIE
uniref:Peroxidase n=1 Tax=Oryza punctata TaxID=4537 RepID=A0A0E0LNW5_ORYPU